MAIWLLGWTPIMLWLTCALVIRNQRILTAHNARQEDNARHDRNGHHATMPGP